MQYLRRNFLPILVGVSATLVAIAAVVVIVDRVRDGGEPARVVRLGALRVDLDELADTIEGLDLDNIDDRGDLDRLREFVRSFGLGELLPSIEGLRERLTAVRVGGGPVLGVTVGEDDGAVVVRGVQPGTPAARAGVEAGDEIVSVDGIRVDAIHELRERLDAIEPGEDYELVVRVASQEVVSQAGRRSPQGDLLRTTLPMQVDVRDHRIILHEGLTNVEDDDGGHRERGRIGAAPQAGIGS